MTTETTNTIASLITLKRNAKPGQADKIQAAVTCLHEQEARLDRYRRAMPVVLTALMGLCLAYRPSAVLEAQAAIQFDEDSHDQTHQIRAVGPCLLPAPSNGTQTPRAVSVPVHYHAARPCGTGGD